MIMYIYICTLSRHVNVYIWSTEWRSGSTFLEFKQVENSIRCTVEGERKAFRGARANEPFEI